VLPLSFPPLPPPPILPGVLESRSEGSLAERFLSREREREKTRGIGIRSERADESDKEIKENEPRELQRRVEPSLSARMTCDPAQSAPKYARRPVSKKGPITSEGSKRGRR